MHLGAAELLNGPEGTRLGVFVTNLRFCLGEGMHLGVCLHQRKLLQEDCLRLPERRELSVVVLHCQFELPGPRLAIPLEVLQVRRVLLESLRCDHQVPLSLREFLCRRRLELRGLSQLLCHSFDFTLETLLQHRKAMRRITFPLPRCCQRLLRLLGHLRESVDDGVRVQSARPSLERFLSVRTLLEEGLDVAALLGFDEGCLNELAEAGDKRIEGLPLRLAHFATAELDERQALLDRRRGTFEFPGGLQQLLLFFDERLVLLLAERSRSAQLTFSVADFRGKVLYLRRRRLDTRRGICNGGAEFLHRLLPIFDRVVLEVRSGCVQFLLHFSRHFVDHRDYLLNGTDLGTVTGRGSGTAERKEEQRHRNNGSHGSACSRANDEQT